MLYTWVCYRCHGTGQSINHKSLCSIATSRLELLHNAVRQSRGEIGWWDLDTIVWRAMSWDADVNDWADVVSAGRVFQMRGAATGKARLPTVESLMEGTTRRLVPAERSVRRPCRSATGTSGPRNTVYISVLWSRVSVTGVVWRCVNEGFERLRQRVPASFMRGRSAASAERRVSKVETLRAAVRYIRHLTTIITHHQHHQQQQQQQQQHQQSDV